MRKRLFSNIEIYREKVTIFGRVSARSQDVQRNTSEIGNVNKTVHIIDEKQCFLLASRIVRVDAFDTPHPRRSSCRDVPLKEALTLYTVRVTHEHNGSIFQKRQHRLRHGR